MSILGLFALYVMFGMMVSLTLFLLVASRSLPLPAKHGESSDSYWMFLLVLAYFLVIIPLFWLPLWRVIDRQFK